MAAVLQAASIGQAVTPVNAERPGARQRRSLSTRVIRRTRWLLRRVLWAGRLVVSAVVLVGVLAALAAIPLLDFYVLGYFLAAEGRVARGERWRNVLPWVRYAPRIAAIAVGTAVMVAPLIVLADFSRDASLIDPDGGSARTLRLLTRVVAVLTAGHLFLAWARGGSLISYFRPIKNVRVAIAKMRRRSFGCEIADRLGRAGAAMRVPALFWLGARGLVVAVVWLFVPCAMLAAAGPMDAGRLLLKLGGLVVLTVVFPGLLVLQAHFATEERLRAGFAVRTGFRMFGRAPLAWLIAGTATAALALPLFLFKIVAPPRDAFWMLTPLFVAAMLPARIATGWAYRRAARRPRRRNWLAIGLAVIGFGAVGMVYSGGVFLAQYIDEHGRRAVFEQHAFALPVPF